MIRHMFPLLLISCYVPELETPDWAKQNNDWTAPENDWPINTPPISLEAEGSEAGKVFEDLRMMDQHGNEVSMWQFYGMVILFDISAQWCAPCKILAKETEETQHDYAEQGFVYLTMIAEDNNSQLPGQEVLVQWAEEAEIESAPVVAPTEDIRPTLIPSGAYPRLFLIDRDMKVINSDIQPQNDTTIRAEIEAAL